MRPKQPVKEGRHVAICPGRKGCIYASDFMIPVKKDAIKLNTVQDLRGRIGWESDSEVPVAGNITQEEANSSSEVLINTPQINLQPSKPGTSRVKPPSPTKHLHKISHVPRLSQVTAEHRIKKTAVTLNIY
ncbi:hypothetical protein AVEN_45970-1 [Araneus ventricosus]|uniref:Uncharacterized protein n=1 Tax=Araneus ventricosus TaxID=182803 RepID=A0A4Y2VUQ3_ARAVE|nr:hypothetical protein AVEN_45970-1 [Araneus ventricosus]